MAVTLADLSPADLQALLGQLRAAEAAQKSEAKLRRDKMRAWIAPHVADAIAEFGTRTMTSGAVGQSVGGTVSVIDPESGKPREARVSMLIRWVDTIPARDSKSDNNDNNDGDDSDS